MNPSRIKAVIFDLDGLVLDSEATYIAAWRQATAEMGFLLPETFWASLSGLSGDAVDRMLRQQCGENFDIDRFHRIGSERWHSQVSEHGIPIKKGFFRLLTVLKQLGLPFCLATNSRRQDALHCLGLAGLVQTFPLVVTRDDVVNGKPAPDIFIESAQLLGIAIGDCLVLEDSAVGVSAAVAAGSFCVCVPSVLPVASSIIAAGIMVMDDLEQVADSIVPQAGELI